MYFNICLYKIYLLYIYKICLYTYFVNINYVKYYIYVLTVYYIKYIHILRNEYGNIKIYISLHILLRRNVNNNR